MRSYGGLGIGKELKMLLKIEVLCIKTETEKHPLTTWALANTSKSVAV